MAVTFETVELLEISESLRPPRKAFLDFFFRKVNTFDTKTVEIDVYKEKQVLAAFTHPNSEGRMNIRTAFERRPYEPGYIKEKMSTRAGEMLNIRRGDVIYNSKETPAQRTVNQMAEDMRELMNMVDRTEEWIAKNLLDGGAVTISGKGFNVELDFDMPAGNIIVLEENERWGDAGINILNDFRLFKRILSQASGRTPNVAFVGSAVIDAMLADTEIQALLDNRRVEIGRIEIVGEDRIDGIEYIGNILGVDIFGYDEQYLLTLDAEPENFMPVNKIFMGSTNAKTSRNYGVIQDRQALYATQYFFKSWEIEDPSVEILLLQSAPLLALSESHAFGSFTVLADPE